MKALDRDDVLPLRDVTINSPFWQGILETVRRVMIPYQWAALNDQIPDAEKSHCLMNFKIAAGEAEGEFGGLVFQDSDVAKWLEAVGYSLAQHPDEALERQADEAIDLIVKAQREDGYLNTYFIIKEPDKRWTNLLDCHELYCAGHLIEAAVAYYQSTGKRKLLDALCRYADHIESLFGPEPGKLKGYPGHEEIELALVKLFQATGRESYLKLAKYFVDERGRQPSYFEMEWEKRGRIGHWTKMVSETPITAHSDADFREYSQFHTPVRMQEKAAGHAVRAVYLYTGMADVAAETGDTGLLEACRRLWLNMTGRQMYITGGIGATPQGEAFTFDYDLPNDTVYAETCASIGLIFFAWRMLLLERDSQYADVIERALYNTVAAAMDQDGRRFFYVNPLEVWPDACGKNPERHHVKAERQKWFGCACCPPNLARLLSSLGSYIYSVRGDDLAVHLYIGGSAKMMVGSRQVTITQKTDYPASGESHIVVQVNQPCEFTLALRVPGWCRDYGVSVNGSAVLVYPVKGYASLRRIWQDGDKVTIQMTMPVELVYANPAIRADAGKVAIQRGPLVYCLEQADNGPDLAAISLPRDARLQVTGCARQITQPGADDGLADNTPVVTVDAVRDNDPEWGEAPYRFTAPARTQSRIKAIPYYLWGNRGAGEMLVWIRQD